MGVKRTRLSLRRAAVNDPKRTFGAAARDAVPVFTNRSRFPVCSDAQAVLACFRTYWPDLFFTVAGLENGTRLPIVATHKLGYWAFRFRSLGTVSDCGLRLTATIRLRRMTDSVAAYRYPPFHCPNCEALYQVVKVEAPRVMGERELTCLSCGGPLDAREGRFCAPVLFLFSRTDLANISPLSSKRLARKH